VPNRASRKLPADPVRVLGVDPGLCRTGYAVLEWTPEGPAVCEGGLIRSTTKRPLAERVLEIGEGLREVVEQFRPAALAIEQVFATSAFPKSAILMAHARGAILYSAAALGLRVQHYSATQIKRLLTGSGRAPKDQIQRAVQLELGLRATPEPPDVADAFAAALCHYFHLFPQFSALAPAARPEAVRHAG